MGKNPHYFWAVSLPSASKRYIDNKLQMIKGNFPFKRWVHMEDYHITLAFLGSMAEDKIDPVIEAVGNGIDEQASFSLQIQGINVFGNKKSPRIFWVSLGYEQKLHTLQSIVHQQCMKTGFQLESRPYTPHITVARNWAGADFDQTTLEKWNPFREAHVFSCSEVVLYKTNIEQTPKYERIAAFSL